jgi:beta-N-acetylhexosaminidase
MTRRFLLLAALPLLALFFLFRNYFRAADSTARETMKVKVGQLIMVGFIGTDATSPGFRRLLRDLQDGVVGGVLFLPRNIVGRSELQEMVQAIKACPCASTPFIAIDAEGGTVDWLRPEHGFDSIPSAATVARGGYEAAHDQYRALANKLIAVGFNMNLAPVVDLNINENNPIIGVRERSFSSDPTVVERYARIFIDEHKAKGIWTVLKHFPGHGSSVMDTHTAPADVEMSWSPEELTPYRHLISSSVVDAVMVGHLVNNRHWGGVATQKGSKAVAGLLRANLGFNGVVMSDDLAMEAVRKSAEDFSGVVKSAAAAGIDLLLVVHPVADPPEESGKLINSALVEALASGELPLDVMERSWMRVMKLKSFTKAVLNR